MTFAVWMMVLTVGIIAAGGAVVVGVLIYSAWKLAELAKEIQAIKQSLAEIKQELSQNP